MCVWSDVDSKTDITQAHQLTEMHKDLEKWSNQARFIQMIIDGKLVVAKRKKVELIAELKQKGFKAFPKVVNAIKKGKADLDAEKQDAEEDSAEDDSTGASDYDYLLGVSSRTCVSMDKTNCTL